MKVCVPLAIQVVIDDVGWWSGEDSSASGGPYRTGINRNHVPDDYRAIAELGRRLGMRPQAALVLCEWDRDNILKNVPTSTWMGERWDNTPWVGEWLDEAADIIAKNSDYLELTLHGIGHEYWDECGMSRSEWYSSNGKMRSADQVLLHLEYYNKLLQRNKLGSFPESFVPPAFIYRFSPYADELAAILQEFGIKYISTPFSTVFKDSEPQGRYFGIEHNIITVDRSWNTIKWCELKPEIPGKITGPVCGLHWPNILHQDPEKNDETVEQWVRFLSMHDTCFDSMLAANTAESFSQAVYNWGTGLVVGENNINIDFNKVNEIKAKGLLNYFYIKTCGNLVLQTASPDMQVTEVLRRFPGDYKVWKVQRYDKRAYGVIEFAECGAY